MAMGRPSVFTQELADIICESIANNVSVREICDWPGFPSLSTVMRWRAQNELFREQYLAARDAQAELLADEAVDIVDNHADDIVMIDGMPLQINGEIIKQKTPASVAHAKLRASVRQWKAERMSTRWAPRGRQEITGPNGSDPFTAFAGTLKSALTDK